METKRISTIVDPDISKVNVAKFQWGDHDLVIEQAPSSKSYALKDAADPRDMAERRMQAALETLFVKWAREAAEKIKAGQSLSDEDIAAELRWAIEPQLVEAATEEGIRIAAEIGVQFDPAIVNARAVEWAQQYGGSMIRDLTETTRKGVANVLARYHATPGMTIGDVEDALLKLAGAPFSSTRAEMIAQTEITKSYAEAQNRYRNELSEQGIDLTRVWLTSNDELTCVVCAPLNKKAEDNWAGRFPDGPPAHPRCRCSLSLKSRG